MPGYDKWIWVRAASIKDAREVQTQNSPELRFFDCDFELLSSGPVTDVKSVESAIDTACQKWLPQPVQWQDYDEGAIEAAKESGKKFVFLAFTSDRKDSQETLDNLTHEAIAKFHDKVLFMKTEYIKDSEESKKWKVMGTPCVLTIDPSRPEGKQIIDRAGGKQSVKALRKMVLDGLKKTESVMKGNSASRSVK